MRICIFTHIHTRVENKEEDEEEVEPKARAPRLERIIVCEATAQPRYTYIHVTHARKSPASIYIVAAIVSCIIIIIIRARESIIFRVDFRWCVCVAVTTATDVVVDQVAQIPRCFIYMYTRALKIPCVRVCLSIEWE